MCSPVLPALWRSLRNVWLKGTFHSSLLSVAHAISLWLQRDSWKEMFCREKRKKEKKKEKESLLVPFLCLWYNRPKMFWYNCFSEIYFSLLTLQKLQNTLAARKKIAVWSQSRCFHLRVGLLKSRQITFHSLKRLLGSSWTDVQDSDPQFFILGLSAVAQAKALCLPTADPATE